MGKRVAVIVPAFNEEKSIGKVVESIFKALPDAEVIVIDDGSTDNTSSIAEENGATLLKLPCNIGYGAALQTGYFYAYETGAGYCLQMDADGQHSAGSLPLILEELQKGENEFVIGVRKFRRDGSGYSAGFIRHAGIAFFALLSSLILKEKLTDTTSGFLGFSDKLMKFFISDLFPYNYPDADVIIMIRRLGFRVKEVPVVMTRCTGKSMHGGVEPVAYFFRMSLSILRAFLIPVNSLIKELDYDKAR